VLEEVRSDDNVRWGRFVIGLLAIGALIVAVLLFDE